MNRKRLTFILAAAFLTLGLATAFLPLFFIPRWAGSILENILVTRFYTEAIQREATRFGLDPVWVAAIIKVESGFRVGAISNRGAIGLMQIMPQTGLEIARDFSMHHVTEEALANPAINIRLGCIYLARLKREFPNDVVAVLAAYNAGLKNAREWTNNGEKVLLPQDIPFPETRQFVLRVESTEQTFRRLRDFYHGRIKN